jgi:hypothetical protein
MKRLFTILLLFIITIPLSGCFIIRESLLAPPEETQIPEDSQIAICIKEEIEYTYIYHLDGVYQFSIDGIIQSEEALNNEQEQAFLHGESVETYLYDEYGTNCTYDDYIEE